MLMLQQLKLSLTQNESDLPKIIADYLHITEDKIYDLVIQKKSIDARKKPIVFISYSVSFSLRNHLEHKLFSGRKIHGLSAFSSVKYLYPSCGEHILQHRPVIAGAGPAGLFCCYLLAKQGFAPILIERGECVEDRTKTVELFWKEGILNPDSNVQFGEGGAGTFSDGKLNTAVHDKSGIIREVLTLFVQFGAPPSIIYDSKPHIGTDILRNVVKNIRNEIIRLGGEVRFHTQLKDFRVKDQKLTGILLYNTITKTEEELACDRLVLATGHSARDIFENMLHKGVVMTQKPFAIGLRVMHRQDMIDRSQYGQEAGLQLPPASYKLTYQASNQKSVYTFCMCPGGYVVNASSEEGRLAINGMSYHARDSKTANSAVIVTVDGKDFGSEDILAGMHFQRRLEEKAYHLANGRIPIQYLKDFCPESINGSVDDQTVYPAIKGNYSFADIASMLPESIKDCIAEAFPYFGACIKGFNNPETLLCAIESRTSSPVRILRDDNYQSSVYGIMPCGEGAGYAGGITSAAADGIRIAGAIISEFSPNPSFCEKLL